MVQASWANEKIWDKRDRSSWRSSHLRVQGHVQQPPTDRCLSVVIMPQPSRKRGRKRLPDEYPSASVEVISVFRENGRLKKRVVEKMPYDHLAPTLPLPAEFLHEFLHPEVPPSVNSSCLTCNSSAEYRCLSCFPGGLVCGPCLLSCHVKTPLHSVQVWF